ncbi:MAG: hypothetical protein P8I94_10040 [Emcibacteraceae bacterium]|nr:hypothetical protein [Emcibacteraceae bacterium]
MEDSSKANRARQVEKESKEIEETKQKVKKKDSKNFLTTETERFIIYILN